jgi:hypothetical protein
MGQLSETYAHAKAFWMQTLEENGCFDDISTKKQDEMKLQAAYQKAKERAFLQIFEDRNPNCFISDSGPDVSDKRVVISLMIPMADKSFPGHTNLEYVHSHAYGSLPSSNYGLVPPLTQSAIGAGEDKHMGELSETYAQAKVYWMKILEDNGCFDSLSAQNPNELVKAVNSTNSLGDARVNGSQERKPASHGDGAQGAASDSSNTTGK